MKSQSRSWVLCYSSFLGRMALFWMMVMGVGCQSENAVPEIRKHDRSTPEGTLKLLFQAIQSQQWDSLAHYCHSQIHNDYDTRLLCEGGNDSLSRAETLLFFGNAAVGDTFMEYGDTAIVPFIFGMSNGDAEEMYLQRVEGKWYLWKF